MKLHYKKIGSGQPLIIMHGLFGQADNWNTLGKLFSEHGLEVYLVDLRNHGHSPHSNEWNYQVMSEDIAELIRDLKLTEHTKPIILGHSMGGKVAMQLALNHSQLIHSIIVSDIAPKYHIPDNEDVMNALKNVNIASLKTRKEAELALSAYIHDRGVLQFLLKNIYWKESPGSHSAQEGLLAWRFNHTTILAQIKNVSENIIGKHVCDLPALFIRGQQSNYITNEDINEINKLFPNNTIVTIERAGHWVHADNPQDFFNAVMSFIKK